MNGSQITTVNTAKKPLLSSHRGWRSPYALGLGFVLSLSLGNVGWATEVSTDPSTPPILDAPSPALPPPPSPFHQEDIIPSHWTPHPAAVEPDLTHLHIDLSDRRLTLFRGESVVKSYPVAVGREGWSTPVGSFEVRQMFQDPPWMNPLTGQVIAGGNPRNPLGQYWIGFWTDGQNWVGMHGTPNPESVGTAASHGCIRLYNADIEEVFRLVSLGMPVIVVP